jgi:gamma-glutamyl-gamma-aminobutyrate hydrolase PuuD
MVNINPAVFNKTKDTYQGLLTYIVGKDAAVKDLFTKLTGIEPIYLTNPQKALDELPLPDIVVFTGGADVSPILYGAKNTNSNSDINRDVTEMLFYSMYAKYKDVLKIGICRGGQFLNVMNAGTMMQHLGGPEAHGNTHSVEPMQWPLPINEATGKSFSQVNSTHHQGILISDRQCMSLLMYKGITESCLYSDRWNKSCSFVFQPHPEYEHEGTTAIFMHFLNEIILFMRKSMHIKFPRAREEEELVDFQVPNFEEALVRMFDAEAFRRIRP